MMKRRLMLLAAARLIGGQRAGDRPRAAFHYSAVFSAEEARWYSQFEILVTGGILDREQTARLRVAGAKKLTAYEWTSAFYPGDAVSATPDWQSAVARHAADWLIQREAEGGGAAEAGKRALWYDFANPEMINSRVRHLADVLRRERYDGYFFDTPGSEYLPEPVRRQFQKRHPGLDYDVGMGGFFAALRRALPPGAIVFTNQAYRHAGVLLPHADLDLSERCFTATTSAGGTLFRPWHDPLKPWESIRTPFAELIEPALKTFPKVTMIHVNYAAGPPDEIARAVVYSFCCAKLFGHESYLIAPSDAESERNRTYFEALGAPAGDRVEEPGGTVIWRPYDQGTVVVQAGGPPVIVKALGVQLPGGLFRGMVLPKS